MRRPFIAGNWKMNLDRAAAVALAEGVARKAEGVDGIVFIDRADVLTRDAKLREWNQVRAQVAVPTGAR